MQYREARAADGTKLAIQEGGVAAGPEILFIHGISQCSLCWAGQFEDPGLAGNFRMAAFDIRGHGGSDQPDAPEYYRDNAQFAGDVEAVMDALGFRRPVLVGWSYAGRIIGDYLESFGTARLAGINYVAARTNNDPAFKGHGTDHLAGMIEPDLATNIDATVKFIRACFAREPERALMDRAIAYNMIVPAHIRRAHLARPPSDGAVLATIDIPVLVSQGSEDTLVLRGLGEFTASVIPGARLSLYEGVGHTPFVEDAARFNRELADFVWRVNGGRRRQ